MTTVNRRALKVWQLEIQAQPVSVSAARRAVRRQLTQWGWYGRRVDDLTTICSELVTNAIVHGSSPGDAVLVRLQEIDGDCRLEVTDTEPNLKPARTREACGESGRVFSW